MLGVHSGQVKDPGWLRRLHAVQERQVFQSDWYIISE